MIDTPLNTPQIQYKGSDVMGNNQMTPAQQRQAEIKKLKAELNKLKAQKRQVAKIEAEKAEIARLRKKLHPSKVNKLKKLLVQLGKGVKEADREFQKLKKEM